MKGARAARAPRLLLLFAFIAIVVSGLVMQLPNTQWSSSLADALPNEVSDLQRSYLKSQQPNSQQLLLGFESKQHSKTEILKVVQEQLRQLFHVEPTLQLAEMTNPKAVLSFYQQQAGRLATFRDRQMLASGDYEALVARAQKTLQSPAPVLTPLRSDPLLLTQRFIQQLPDLMPGYESHGGLYTRSSESTRQVLVPLRIAGDALSVNQSGQSVKAINDFTSKVTEQLPGIQLYKSGLLFHSDAAAKQAKKEMTWFGGLSLLVVLALLLWVFRSWENGLVCTETGFMAQRFNHCFRLCLTSAAAFTFIAAIRHFYGSGFNHCYDSGGDDVAMVAGAKRTGPALAAVLPQYDQALPADA